MAATKRILVIVTNVDEYKKSGMRTGLWLGELTHFWDVAEPSRFSMDIASPSGGKVPLDPESLSHEVLEELNTGKRYENRRFMDLLEDTKKISEVNVEDYDAIYLTGGHGVMFDFPQSQDLESLMAKFYETGRVVSTVCHGATGLLNVTLSDGEPLVKGKSVTGFSWPEEELANRAQAVPYNLQEELKRLGANYSTADEPFETYVVEEGRLITGQNPGSARAVAEAVVRQLTAA
ncbi:type 1 glutamine amidotransferase domain-containing protein [Streptomyces sp. NBC_01761]|uniref:type 1 glutamine amidotransferase domain-containing protein n=1 Tax=Streptomyces sp. NBC_01761 TaxID=2975932 RepID=UPI002DD7CB81|nr:type 1 glutamine amidotransferase domain-containing protein [Streptomyces sp. NBC_01761]WSC58034.1 type 1 glutamine amidotransferase domain-containing protein [Streptomyces sp. NBC_01761]